MNKQDVIDKMHEAIAKATTKVISPDEVFSEVTADDIPYWSEEYNWGYDDGEIHFNAYPTYQKTMDGVGQTHFLLRSVVFTDTAVYATDSQGDNDVNNHFDARVVRSLLID